MGYKKDAFDRYDTLWSPVRALLTFNLLRGIVCGETDMSIHEFVAKLKEASETRFGQEDYRVRTNNCRDFCHYFIFDVLKPTNKEQGES